MANRLIKFQSVSYMKANGRALNAARQYVPAFEAPFSLKCSVQAVDRKTYAAMGLDFNAHYVNIFASLDLIDLDRDSSGDRFVFNGWLYQMSKGQNWHYQDGWATCLATRIEPYVPPALATLAQFADYGMGTLYAIMTPIGALPETLTKVTLVGTEGNATTMAGITGEWDANVNDPAIGSLFINTTLPQGSDLVGLKANVTAAV